MAVPEPPPPSTPMPEVSPVSNFMSLTQQEGTTNILDVSIDSKSVKSIIPSPQPQHQLCSGLMCYLKTGEDFTVNFRLIEPLTNKQSLRVGFELECTNPKDKEVITNWIRSNSNSPLITLLSTSAFAQTVIYNAGSRKYEFPWKNTFDREQSLSFRLNFYGKTKDCPLRFRVTTEMIYKLTELCTTGDALYCPMFIYKKGKQKVFNVKQHGVVFDPYCVRKHKSSEPLQQAAGDQAQNGEQQTLKRANSVDDQGVLQSKKARTEQRAHPWETSAAYVGVRQIKQEIEEDNCELCFKEALVEGATSSEGGENTAEAPLEGLVPQSQAQLDHRVEWFSATSKTQSVLQPNGAQQTQCLTSVPIDSRKSVQSHPQHKTSSKQPSLGSVGGQMSQHTRPLTSVESSQQNVHSGTNGTVSDSVSSALSQSTELATAVDLQLAQPAVKDPMSRTNPIRNTTPASVSSMDQGLTSVTAVETSQPSKVTECEPSASQSMIPFTRDPLGKAIPENANDDEQQNKSTCETKDSSTPRSSSSTSIKETKPKRKWTPSDNAILNHVKRSIRCPTGNIYMIGEYKLRNRSAAWLIRILFRSGADDDLVKSAIKVFKHIFIKGRLVGREWVVDELPTSAQMEKQAKQQLQSPSKQSSCYRNTQVFTPLRNSSSNPSQARSSTMAHTSQTVNTSKQCDPSKSSKSNHNSITSTPVHKHSSTSSSVLNDNSRPVPANLYDVQSNPQLAKSTTRATLPSMPTLQALLQAATISNTTKRQLVEPSTIAPVNGAHLDATVTHDSGSRNGNMKQKKNRSPTDEIHKIGPLDLGKEAPEQLNALPPSNQIVNSTDDSQSLPNPQTAVNHAKDVSAQQNQASSQTYAPSKQANSRNTVQSQFVQSTNQPSPFNAETNQAAYPKPSSPTRDPSPPGRVSNHTLNSAPTQTILQQALLAKHVLVASDQVLVPFLEPNIGSFTPVAQSEQTNICTSNALRVNTLELISNTNTPPQSQSSPQQTQTGDQVSPVPSDQVRVPILDPSLKSFTPVVQSHQASRMQAAQTNSSIFMNPQLVQSQQASRMQAAQTNLPIAMNPQLVQSQQASRMQAAQTNLPIAMNPQMVQSQQASRMQAAFCDVPQARQYSQQEIIAHHQAALQQTRLHSANRDRYAHLYGNSYPQPSSSLVSNGNHAHSIGGTQECHNQLSIVPAQMMANESFVSQPNKAPRSMQPQQQTNTTRSTQNRMPPCSMTNQQYCCQGHYSNLFNHSSNKFGNQQSNHFKGLWNGAQSNRAPFMQGTKCTQQQQYQGQLSNRPGLNHSSQIYNNSRNTQRQNMPNSDLRGTSLQRQQMYSSANTAVSPWTPYSLSGQSQSGQRLHNSNFYDEFIGAQIDHQTPQVPNYFTVTNPMQNNKIFHAVGREESVQISLNNSKAPNQLQQQPCLGLAASSAQTIPQYQKTNNQTTTNHVASIQKKSRTNVISNQTTTTGTTVGRVLLAQRNQNARQIERQVRIDLPNSASIESSNGSVQLQSTAQQAQIVNHVSQIASAKAQGQCVQPTQILSTSPQVAASQVPQLSTSNPSSIQSQTSNLALPISPVHETSAHSYQTDSILVPSVQQSFASSLPTQVAKFLQPPQITTSNVSSEQSHPTNERPKRQVAMPSTQKCTKATQINTLDQIANGIPMQTTLPIAQPVDDVSPVVSVAQMPESSFQSNLAPFTSVDASQMCTNPTREQPASTNSPIDATPQSVQPSGQVISVQKDQAIILHSVTQPTNDEINLPTPPISPSSDQSLVPPQSLSNSLNDVHSQSGNGPVASAQQNPQATSASVQNLQPSKDTSNTIINCQTIYAPVNSSGGSHLPNHSSAARSQHDQLTKQPLNLSAQSGEPIETSEPAQIQPTSAQPEQQIRLIQEPPSPKHVYLVRRSSTSVLNFASTCASGPSVQPNHVSEYALESQRISNSNPTNSQPSQSLTATNPPQAQSIRQLPASGSQQNNQTATQTDNSASIAPQQRNSSSRASSTSAPVQIQTSKAQSIQQEPMDSDSIQSRSLISVQNGNPGPVTNKPTSVRSNQPMTNLNIPVPVPSVTLSQKSSTSPEATIQSKLILSTSNASNVRPHTAFVTSNHTNNTSNQIVKDTQPTQSQPTASQAQTVIDSRVDSSAQLKVSCFQKITPSLTTVITSQSPSVPTSANESRGSQQTSARQSSANLLVHSTNSSTCAPQSQESSNTSEPEPKDLNTVQPDVPIKEEPIDSENIHSRPSSLMVNCSNPSPVTLNRSCTQSGASIPSGSVRTSAQQGKANILKVSATNDQPTSHTSTSAPVQIQTSKAQSIQQEPMDSDSIQSRSLISVQNGNPGPVTNKPSSVRSNPPLTNLNIPVPVPSVTQSQTSSTSPEATIQSKLILSTSNPSNVRSQKPNTAIATSNPTNNTSNQIVKDTQPTQSQPTASQAQTVNDSPVDSSAQLKESCVQPIPLSITPLITSQSPSVPTSVIESRGSKQMSSNQSSANRTQVVHSTNSAKCAPQSNDRVNSNESNAQSTQREQSNESSNNCTSEPEQNNLNTVQPDVSIKEEPIDSENIHSRPSSLMVNCSNPSPVTVNRSCTQSGASIPSGSVRTSEKQGQATILKVPATNDQPISHTLISAQMHSNTAAQLPIPDAQSTVQANHLKVKPYICPHIPCPNSLRKFVLKVLENPTANIYIMSRGYDLRRMSPETFLQNLFAHKECDDTFVNRVVALYTDIFKDGHREGQNWIQNGSNTKQESTNSPSQTAKPQNVNTQQQPEASCSSTNPNRHFDSTKHRSLVPITPKSANASTNSSIQSQATSASIAQENSFPSIPNSLPMSQEGLLNENPLCVHPESVNLNQTESEQITQPNTLNNAQHDESIGQTINPDNDQSQDVANSSHCSTNAISEIPSTGNQNNATVKTIHNIPKTTIVPTDTQVVHTFIRSQVHNAPSNNEKPDKISMLDDFDLHNKTQPMAHESNQVTNAGIVQSIEKSSTPNRTESTQSVKSVVVKGLGERVLAAIKQPESKTQDMQIMLEQIDSNAMQSIPMSSVVNDSSITVNPSYVESNPPLSSSTSQVSVPGVKPNASSSSRPVPASPPQAISPTSVSYVTQLKVTDQPQTNSCIQTKRSLRSLRSRLVVSYSEATDTESSNESEWETRPDSTHSILSSRNASFASEGKRKMHSIAIQNLIHIPKQRRSERVEEKAVKSRVSKNAKTNSKASHVRQTQPQSKKISSYRLSNEGISSDSAYTSQGSPEQDAPHDPMQIRIVIQYLNTLSSKPICVCKSTNYFDKKQLVPCFNCEDFFHPEHIKMPIEKAQQFHKTPGWEFECYNCNTDSPDHTKWYLGPHRCPELYTCFCNKPFDHRKAYVQCDRCEQHFHQSCFGLVDKHAKLLPEFFCQQCTQLNIVKGRLVPTYKEAKERYNEDVGKYGEKRLAQIHLEKDKNSLRQLTIITRLSKEKDNLLFKRAINYLRKNKYSEFFHSKIPDYKYVYLYNMSSSNEFDFDSIWEKIEKREFENVGEFVVAVNEMFHCLRRYTRRILNDFQKDKNYITLPEKVEEVQRLNVMNLDKLYILQQGQQKRLDEKHSQASSGKRVSAISDPKPTYTTLDHLSTAHMVFISRLVTVLQDQFAGYMKKYFGLNVNWPKEFNENPLSVVDTDDEDSEEEQVSVAVENGSSISSSKSRKINASARVGAGSRQKKQNTTVPMIEQACANGTDPMLNSSQNSNLISRQQSFKRKNDILTIEKRTRMEHNSRVPQQPGTSRV